MSRRNLRIVNALLLAASSGGDSGAIRDAGADLSDDEYMDLLAWRGEADAGRRERVLWDDESKATRIAILTDAAVLADAEVA